MTDNLDKTLISLIFKATNHKALTEKTFNLFATNEEKQKMIDYLSEKQRTRSEVNIKSLKIVSKRLGINM